MGINLILETMDLFLTSLTFKYFVEKRMAYNGVNNSIIKHKTLCPSQYRFCKHCSSEHALLDIVGKIQKYMDKTNNFPVAFLLIYEKPLIVLTTMFLSINYVIMDNVVSSSQWFCSYLTG